MEDEYLSLLRLFHEADVEYVVVGGYAVIAYGFPRTTGDLDILVHPTPANARRILRALERYGYAQGEFEEADFLTTPNFLSFASNGVWFDLMTELLGVTFEQCLANCLDLTFAGVPVRYLGLAALRQAKPSRPVAARSICSTW